MRFAREARHPETTLRAVDEPSELRAADEPNAHAINLSAADTRALWLEMLRRGWQAFPVGLWSETLGQLQARAETAEAKFEQAKRLAFGTFEEFNDVERRRLRCEAEAELLADQLIGGEVSALEQGDTEA
jgi:hypothetical protein